MAIFQQAVFKAGAAGSPDTHVTTSQVPADERPQPGGLNSKDALSPRAGGWPSKLSVSSQLPCRHPTLPVAGRAWASWLVAAWLQALPLPFPVSGLRMAFSVPGVHLWTPDTPGECVSKSLSQVSLFATPWPTQSMEFSRPEHWSGWPSPSPGDLPYPGIKPRSPTLQADFLPFEPPGKPR